MSAFALQTHAQDLNGGQTPKVWSLLVTVFGELAQVKGARISSPVLRRLTALLGVKPEALRVALHRLRKDGWIDSTRTGRSSAYHLTDLGRTQSARASPRIYGSRAPADAAWLAVWESRPEDVRGLDGAWITPNVMLSSEPVASPDALVTRIEGPVPVPQWIKDRLCDKGTISMARSFCRALERLRRDLEARPPQDLFQRAAVRILIVHNWRRIALRTPELADVLLNDVPAIGNCRKEVTRILSLIPRSDLSELEAALEPACVRTPRGG